MSPGGLPMDVQQFVKERIRSIEQLEILLLLRGESARHWTSAEVNQVVRSSDRSVRETLEALVRQGLVAKSGETDPRFTFAPQNPQLAQTISGLAELYVEKRVRVVEAIYGDRVSEVDEFAKAFRLRKDPNA